MKFARIALVLFGVGLGVGLGGCAPTSGADIGVATDALRVCAASDTTLGVDVSFYQGTIDWPRVGAAGYAFAFARVSDGLDHSDPAFADNWAGIRAAGLVRGAYQYFEPGEDAASQAELVVDGVGVLGASDLPVVIDVEAAGSEPAPAIVASIHTWVDRVTAGTGKAPIIYTARYFWDADVRTVELGQSPLWVADYGASCPDLPNGWEAWQFWQFGTRSGVPGVSAEVDVDRFNGSPDALGIFTEGAARSSPSDRRAVVKVPTAPPALPDPAKPDAGLASCTPREPRDAGEQSFESDRTIPVTSDNDAGHIASAPRGDGEPFVPAPSPAPEHASPASAGCEIRAPEPGQGPFEIWCWSAFVLCLCRRRRSSVCRRSRTFRRTG